MKKCRFRTPFDWLQWKATGSDAAWLRDALIKLGRQVDPDTIQDLFEEEMDKEGYFENEA